MKTPSWLERARDTRLQVRDFINGHYVECGLGNTSDDDKALISDSASINKYSPRDGSLLYQVDAGTVESVDNAVQSARDAFNDGRWSGLLSSQRKAVLQQLVTLIEANHEELALLECLDVGKPISTALHLDIPVAMSMLNSAIEHTDKIQSPAGSDGGTVAYGVREPVGVVGAIIGWNFPLVLAVVKAAPALAMGNSLVLKPSEFSSLSAGRLAELAVEAGVPAGVFNVVHGSGAIVGDALAKHPDIDLLSFTGSTVTGKQMMIAAGQSNMKRLLLECGGKSPFIVFDDCPDNLDMIAGFVVQQAFLNQGENCKAGSRLLVQEGIKEKLLAKVIEQAAQLKPQDPLDPNAGFGALINEGHFNKVLAYIEKGKEQGATLVLGGNAVEVDLAEGCIGSKPDNSQRSGYYIEPTIFDHVDPNSTIAQEEIFGPVLSVITFKDDDEAIAIANNSCFGLQAYAATQSVARAQRLGRDLKAGNLMVIASSTPNMGNVSLPSEPQQQSGMGAEMGLAGLLSYSVSTVVDIHA